MSLDGYGNCHVLGRFACPLPPRFGRHADVRDDLAAHGYSGRASSTTAAGSGAAACATAPSVTLQAQLQLQVQADALQVLL